MGKEQENQENLQEAARTAIKGLAISLLQSRLRLKERGILPRKRKYLEAQCDETAGSIIELRNRFFPDKTLKEILSEPNKPTRGSRTAF